MSRLWERPVVAPVCLVRWSRIMALFVLYPGAIECLAGCDGFVAWRSATLVVARSTGLVLLYLPSAGSRRRRVRAAVMSVAQEAAAQWIRRSP